MDELRDAIYDELCERMKYLIEKKLTKSTVISNLRDDVFILKDRIEGYRKEISRLDGVILELRSENQALRGSSVMYREILTDAQKKEVRLAETTNMLIGLVENRKQHDDREGEV